MTAWTSAYQLRDLESPNTLLEVASRRARGSDLIFLATGPDATSLAMAQNTAHMLARLGLQGHAVLLADSLETCERVGERILGADACFWTSRMVGVRPSHSVSLQRYWDWRFRFYWAKKHYVAELLRLGFSVLQADTDTVWVHDPFPALHQICRATNASLVGQTDNPFVNAGLFYARPGRASQLMLDEMTWRIGIFQNHPWAVPRLVPFATPPFYSNSDDQTIFNDVIISATLGSRSFLGSTARMEARSRHNAQHGPEWQTLPESKEHLRQIKAVSRLRRNWQELQLPWVQVQAEQKAPGVNYVPIGFGETYAFAPVALFGHLKTGGAASVIKRPLYLVITPLAAPELGACASSGHATPGGSGWLGTPGEGQVIARPALPRVARASSFQSRRAHCAWPSRRHGAAQDSSVASRLKAGVCGQAEVPPDQGPVAVRCALWQRNDANRRRAGGGHARCRALQRDLSAVGAPGPDPQKSAQRGAQVYERRGGAPRISRVAAAPW